MNYGEITRFSKESAQGGQFSVASYLRVGKALAKKRTDDYGLPLE